MKNTKIFLSYAIVILVIFLSAQIIIAQQEYDDKFTLATKMRKASIIQEKDFLDYMMAEEQLNSSSSKENVNIIRKVYDDFASGDIAKVLDALDANVVWNEAEGNTLADGNPYIGPDAVLKGVFARIGAQYEYFKLKDIQLHEMSNNMVLATLRYDAKLKENGALIDAQAAHLWSLKNGKIIAFQQYVDTYQLAEAENTGR